MSVAGRRIWTALDAEVRGLRFTDGTRSQHDAFVLGHYCFLQSLFRHRRYSSRSLEEIEPKTLFQCLPLGAAGNSLIHNPVLRIAVDDQPEQIGPGIMAANIGNCFCGKDCRLGCW